jgi:pimeloyl-ACP methyl ester carboxylesterase
MPQALPMPGFTNRVVSTNGIRLAVRDEGSGPAVVLCHGFPELAYSWLATHRTRTSCRDLFMR